MKEEGKNNTVDNSVNLPIDNVYIRENADLLFTGEFTYYVNMFALDPLHPQQNAIIEIVSMTPNITMSELHETLKRRYGIKISLQHVYRIVTEMTNEQMIIKTKGKLHTNLMWLSFIGLFAERARTATALGAVSEGTFPLKEGERKSFSANSLMGMETIWNHLLAQLSRVVEEKDLYKYYSHAWWQLEKIETQKKAYAEIAKRGIRCHYVFGNDTFLDTKGVEILEPTFSAKNISKPPFPKEGYNLNVFGEYILECVFPEKISKQLSFFFTHVLKDDDFDREMFLDILSKRFNYTVTVWRNTEQAKQLRAKMIACL